MKILKNFLRTLLPGIILFVVFHLFIYFSGYLYGLHEQRGVYGPSMYPGGYGTPFLFYVEFCGIQKCEKGFLIDKFLLDLVIFLVLWVIFRWVTVKASINNSEKLKWYEWLIMIPMYLSVIVFGQIEWILSSIIGWWFVLKIFRNNKFSWFLKISLVVITIVSLLYLRLLFLLITYPR
jgi:hypothetical protein